MSLCIREVTSENWRGVAELTVAGHQQTFIESNAYSLAESQFETNWVSIGIYDEDTLIGYAMYGLDLMSREVWLDRFMIDYHFQGKGYARKIFPMLLRQIRQEYSCKRIYLSVHKENFPAMKLYESFGFRLTGEEDTGGEAVMVLQG
ncbi:GNAT family N-acetyltransferase [Paenibacillus sp. FJAT-26967]|uniref:GNAT family N-acetyltransferase n=1 Tax=Paenibacillus sp. FJAT-26967 TaxID=1729690 RepID=UPI000839830A|nr:GNAT family N-acetyltransferase [Paenibacillus sp. FJAT-26967]